MRTTIVIAWMLAWFNLLIWGLLILLSIQQLLATPTASMLTIYIFFAAIPLNSFAALQLHRSIRHTRIKLSHQAPVGIRFVGMFALLVGAFIAAAGFILAKSAKEMLPVWAERVARYKPPVAMATAGFLHSVGVFLLVLGMAAILSAMMNIRLLRWYYLVKQSDVF